MAAARARATTARVGTVGQDAFAGLALDALRADAVAVDSVAAVPGSTGIAHIRVNAATGENDIAIVPEANASLTAERVESELRRLADPGPVVLVQLEIPLEAVLAATRTCAELGLRLILDPRSRAPAARPGVGGDRSGVPERDRSADPDRGPGQRRRLRRATTVAGASPSLPRTDQVDRYLAGR